MSKDAKEQPIAVYYSTTRFFSKSPSRLSDIQEVEIAVAYAKALDSAEISLKDFINWYRVLDEREKSKRSDRILDKMNSAISVFLKDVKDLKLNAKESYQLSVQKNEKDFYLNQLSGGEQGLLALVFDLTRRLSIANPASDNPAKEGEAIVLIDEIELHLHPEWQRSVISRLCKVFQNCQFIVTTHSPQVLGQVEADKVRCLGFDNSGEVVCTVPPQSRGMDSSWVLQNIMGTNPRDRNIETKLDEIYDAIDNGEYDKARQAVTELRKEIGDFPDLQEAYALLDRFRLLGEK